MEVYAKVVNASGQPIVGANLQRLYPDGQGYSSALFTDETGTVNGRVPDGTYKWYITAPGYKSKLVLLNTWQGGTVLVSLDKGTDTPNVQPPVVTNPGTAEPGSGGSSNTALYWVLGIAGVTSLAIYKRWIKLPKF